MASTREIRRRIRSVKNIAQVTRAMEAVAASKMRRAQQQVLATRPYANKAREVLSYIARLDSGAGAMNALITTRTEIKKVGIILITADRGLAGGFNANVLRRNAAFMTEQRGHAREVEVIAVGKKGRDWLLRYDPVIRAEFSEMSDAPTSSAIGPISRIAIDDFLAGRFDEVHLIYTDFVNTLMQRPLVQQLLPSSRQSHRLRFRPIISLNPVPRLYSSRCWWRSQKYRFCRVCTKALPANIQRAWLPCVMPPKQPMNWWTS